MKRLMLTGLILAAGLAYGQQSPHGGELTVPCLDCHTTDSWKMRPDAKFDHASTGFALAGQHRFLECRSCHTDMKFAGTEKNCLSCHTDVHNSELGPECLRCHTMTSWAVTDMRQKHQQTRFPLVGRHLDADCESCHSSAVPRRFAATSPECISCHREEYAATMEPSHTMSGFAVACADCHKVTAPAWKGSFDHDLTAFPLTGAHRAIICSECHTNNKFGKLPVDCFSCHEPDFTATVSPAHAAGNFSHECLSCHTTAAWRPASFDHNLTGFPLTGKHLGTACQDCHINGNYQLTYTDCYQCHQQDFSSASNPNHQTGGFDHNCLSCHTTAGWSPATFDHSKTAFPLTGKHTNVSCGDCHRNGNYQLTYTDCYQCHQQDYNSVTNPNHVANNYDHNCATCHSTSGWGDASFNHSTTAFPLTGAHTSITCANCHVNDNYQLAFTDCYACHQQDYTAVTNPSHTANGYDHNCSTCHSTSDWGGASFDHNTTAFALTGAHTSIACASCHVNGNYQLSYTDCYACHQSNFTSAVDPDHQANAFDHNCATCHSTVNWTPSTFDHNATAFALTGAHTSITCAGCHTGGNYQLAYSDCYACHQADYTAVTNPNHAANGYDHNCATCHTTVNWDVASFDHNTTAFPLTGAHTSITCATCHVNGNYQLAYTDCYACHQQNYAAATNPDHTGNGYDHNCSTCHTTAAWSPATFDHNTTAFALTGSHTTAACASCHVNNNYQLAYADCYQCHQTEFSGVADPDHVIGNFGHDCTPCHTTTAWSPSTFDHDGQYFRIYSGRHNGRWSSCATCHDAPADYGVFTCISCHEHNQTETDGHHGSVANYIYNRTSCYTCHRNV